MKLTLQQRIEQKKELIADLFRQIDNEKKALWALQDQLRISQHSVDAPSLIDGEPDPTLKEE